MNSTKKCQTEGEAKRQPPPKRPVIVRILRALKRHQNQRRRRTQKRQSEHQTNERMMARWRRHVGLFTGALVVVGLVTAAIFWRQLSVMQGQLDILEQQVIDAREMQRAFITASDYKITKIPGVEPTQSCWGFRPIISNVGGSPTVEMRYVIEIVFVLLPRPGEQGSAWGLIMAPTDPDAVFKRSGGWYGALLGPKQNLPDTATNDKVCLTKDDSPYLFAPQRVYARGAIHYHDRYPGAPEHITKYCFWIRAVEDGGGWKPEPALCSHWNCADEECDREKGSYTAEVAEKFKSTGQTIEGPLEFTR